MRYIVYGLVVLLIAIQYPLWIGKGGWLHVYQMDKEVQSQEAINRELENRNNKITGDVNDLRQGTRAVEERARIEHGMVKESETMVQIVQSDEELPKPVSKQKLDKKEEVKKETNTATDTKESKTSSVNKKSVDKEASTEKVAQ
ncbi:MAG: cell division protein FtsB [Betaproteobacteria bacterium]